MQATARTRMIMKANIANEHHSYSDLAVVVGLETANKGIIRCYRRRAGLSRVEPLARGTRLSGLLTKRDRRCGRSSRPERCLLDTDVVASHGSGDVYTLTLNDQSPACDPGHRRHARYWMVRLARPSSAGGFVGR